MKFSIQSQTTKKVTITSLFVAAFLVVYLVYITLGKTSERQGDKPNKDNDSSMKDDSTNNPGGPSQSNGNTAPPPTDDKPPANTPPILTECATVATSRQVSLPLCYRPTFM